MVAVIGVVFATVWAGPVNYQDEKTEPGVFEKTRDVSFDGPGTWKVAIVQPSLTMGSIAIAERTRSTRSDSLTPNAAFIDIFSKSAAGNLRGQGAL
ncbi:hypothetical protein EDB19DRAFT_1917477 [Suillus lakei]|nr:hypothetical protein EDB19DRAFT_1917477 [Suillus lakei]